MPSLPDLQGQLDAFRLYYNQSRPHCALDGRTPAQGFAARVKAGPVAELASIHQLFLAGAQVRIVTEEGQLLRVLTIDPTRDYQLLTGRWPVHNVLGQASGMS